MKKIVTFLTFQEQAEEAVHFYTSLFNNSRILDKKYFGGANDPNSLSISFELEGNEYIAINGGPSFQFSPGISILVNCNNQEEIDELWEKLKDGGEEQGPAWVKDRFGVSWQIFHPILREYLTDPDTDRANRVMQAMLQMRKLDIEKLKAAYEGQ